MATQVQLKEELVEEFGYNKNDFIGENGKPLTVKQLEKKLKEEKAKLANVEGKTASALDEFDEEVGGQFVQKFKDDDMINVMSGVNGAFEHHSNAGNGVFKFKGFGQKTQMPYKELKSMNNVSRDTFERGWLLILNKDLIEEFNLIEEYTHFLTPKMVNEILSMRTNEIREVIENLAPAMKTVLYDEARKRIAKGTLDSAFIVKTLEEVYDVSLDDNLPLH